MSTHGFAAVLFDLDGTLIDTAPDFHWVINALLKEEGKPEVSYAFIRQYVSNGARAMVEAAFNFAEGEAEFSRLHARMLDIYLSHLAVNSQLFEGLDTCLAYLEQQQIPWGIVTNKPELYTTPLLDGLGLTKRCSTTICPDHVTHKKPDPEALYLACREINVAPSECIYVGDHIRDIQAGQRAGMTTVAASYGYLDTDEDIQSWQADHIIDDSTALLPLLHSL